MHILQDPDWAAFQHSLGKTTYTEQGKDWSYLAISEPTPLGTYLMVPRGPYAATPAALRPALSSLRALAKQQKAIFVRIEPEQQIPKTIQKSLKKVKSTNPEHTWVLDLTEDKTTLLSGFSQGTRTRYNTFASKGLTVTTSRDPADIKHLVSLQQKIAKQKGFIAFSEKYLRAELEQPFTTLYLVHYEGRIIAASLMFDHADTRYYMQSAADPAYRKLPATVALLATAIFDAQREGKKHFDFWGVTTSEDPRHPWHGFTEFKKSFGGRLVSYPGTYDIILSRPKYLAYSLLRRINLFLRHL